MCLILFAHRASAEYPLLVAANRDEFHARPTAASDFWQEHPGVLAGRDLEAGGTWMGISADRRFAAVTNYRDPQRTAPAPRSRGELTSLYLTGDQSPRDYLLELEDRADDYAGFNLLLGDGKDLWYFSNQRTGNGGPRALAPGIYGLSNAALDTPWPKVTRGKQALQQLLAGAPTHERLAVTVSDRELATPGQLSGQGLHGEMDQLLSAQFIVNPTYGTRATTTLWQDATGRRHWRETSFAPTGEPSGAVEKVVP
ncbi:NRDE family protein [Pseudohalioglobus sediminis]|uniref:NRDE family protein n=1 Tax=Pseudohalioglobus sediminis TaxID=2606449 RepID=A0A5B0WTT3_9GAMM|nr:NRDE family protein [Pseudohalioglobus sediminis]KAA1189715.1 NRDE family protein [Pseudohalioglobus sediminis]